MVTVVAQFAAKTINSERAIYFFSFKSCSINKHMPYVIHMQKKYFFGFTWKKMFAQENGRGAVAPPAPCLLSTALDIYFIFDGSV